LLALLALSLAVEACFCSVVVSVCHFFLLGFLLVVAFQSPFKEIKSLKAHKMQIKKLKNQNDR